MKRVKLLLVAPTFYPTHGGAELRFFRYLPLLKEQGVDVKVVSGTPKRKKFMDEDWSGDWRTVTNGKLISVKQIQQAEVYKYKLPEKNETKRLAILLDQAIKHCEDEESRPDVVHIISSLSTKLIPKLAKLKSMGVAIVFSYCLAHSFSAYPLKRYWQKSRVRKVYKHYDTIITASQVLKDLVLDIAPNADVKIIPNGVDTEKFSPAKNEEEKLALREKLSLPVKGKFITLVGAIHPRKGTDLLVRAWAELIKDYDGLHLILVGPRYDQTREELKDFKLDMEKIIGSSSKSENVHFVGQVGNVEEYLKVSDMFVFPSAKEGMPNAVLEAMACGLPIVLTRFVGLSDDFGVAGRQYLLSDRASAGLETNILALLKNLSLSKNLSENAKEWISLGMSIEQSVKHHAKTYADLVK